MFFLILQIAFIIIATIFVYKTAKDNGYNAILWAAIAVITFFGVQFILGIIVGIFWALGMIYLNWTPESEFGLTMIINLIILALGAGSVLLILRHVNQIRDDEIVDSPPPPPTEFKL